MALSKELHSIAVNLLKNVSENDLDELIKVLSYFNQRCKEKHRSLCLQNGCEQPEPEEKELRRVEKRIEELVKSLIKESSQNFYMQTSTPTCKCCGR